MNNGTITNTQEQFIGSPVQHPFSYIKQGLDTSFLYEVTMNVSWNLNDSSDKSMMNLNINGQMIQNSDFRMNQQINGLISSTQLKSIVYPNQNGTIEMVGYFGTEYNGTELIINSVLYTIKQIEI